MTETTALDLEPALQIEVMGLGDDRIDYHLAWARQRELHALVAAGQARNSVLLVEHPPVYTAGRRTAAHERPFDGTPVVDVDRGGKITWHGPGQLVGYPIVRLSDPIDVVAYVRRVEQLMIEVCAELGLSVGRVEGRTGAWLPADPSSIDQNGSGRRERKIAAIGIRVAQGVTMHGFAINCDPDLTAFTRIVPCGIPDDDVTSLSAELGRDITVDEVLAILTRRLPDADLTGSARHGRTSHGRGSP